MSSPCTCDPGPEGQHQWYCWPAPTEEERRVINGRKCMLWLDEAHTEQCTEDSTDRVTVAGCSVCWLADFPSCVGHPVCDEHARIIRAEDASVPGTDDTPEG